MCISKVIPESESIHRLRDTARKLLGEIEMGPDLATQLMASGPQTRLGMSQQDFGRWLMARVEHLENNRIPNDLVEWIAEVEPHLRFLESEIISWLKGVRDFRYPVAMYKAAISYFDHQVGVFLDALRSHGVYDDSAIIFLSPHGEVLDEHDLHFHHHVLFESVLRIPAIVKPPVDCAFTPGSAIAGVFDLIDVYPTVMEMLGCTAPNRLAGVSRWPSQVSVSKRETNGEVIGRPAAAAYVIGDCVGRVLALPASVAGSPVQIHVFPIREIALVVVFVTNANRFQHLSPVQRGGSRYSKDFLGAIVLASVGFSFSSVLRGAASSKHVPGAVQDRSWLPVFRHAEQLAAYRPQSGITLQCLHESLNKIRTQGDVVVEGHVVLAPGTADS